MSRYIGKLENDKQFDANTSGKPFTFTLGRGEVIKGWDEGLSGMAVGGERRLVVSCLRIHRVRLGAQGIRFRRSWHTGVRSCLGSRSSASTSWSESS